MTDEKSNVHAFNPNSPPRRELGNPRLKRVTAGAERTARLHNAESRNQGYSPMNGTTRVHNRPDTEDPVFRPHSWYHTIWPNGDTLHTLHMHDSGEVKHLWLKNMGHDMMARAKALHDGDKFFSNIYREPVKNG